MAGFSATQRILRAMPSPYSDPCITRTVRHSHDFFKMLFSTLDVEAIQIGAYGYNTNARGRNEPT